MEKVSSIKVDVMNVLKNLEQKADDKQKQMGYVIRGADIVKQIKK